MNLVRACLAGIVTLCYLSTLGHSFTIPQTSIGANGLTADMTGTDLKDSSIPLPEANAFTQQHSEGAYDEYARNNEKLSDYNDIRHNRENPNNLKPINPDFDPNRIPKNLNPENIIATLTDDILYGNPYEINTEFDISDFKNICRKTSNIMSLISSNPNKLTPKLLQQALDDLGFELEDLYPDFVSKIDCYLPNKCQYIESVVLDLNSISTYADKMLNNDTGFDHKKRGKRMREYATEIKYISLNLLEEIIEKTHLCVPRFDCDGIEDSEHKDRVIDPLNQQIKSKPKPILNRKCNPFNTFKSHCKKITYDSISILTVPGIPKLQKKNLVYEMEKLSKELRSGVDQLYKGIGKFKKCLTLNTCDGVDRLAYDLNVLQYRASLRLNDFYEIRSPKMRERGKKACNSIIEMTKNVLQAITQENNKCFKFDENTSFLQDKVSGHAGKTLTDSNKESDTDKSRIRRSLSIDPIALRPDDNNPINLQDFSIGDDNNSDEGVYAHPLSSDINDDAVYQSDYENRLSDINDNDTDEHIFDRSRIPCTNNCSTHKDHVRSEVLSH